LWRPPDKTFITAAAGGTNKRDNVYGSEVANVTAPTQTNVTGIGGPNHSVLENQLTVASSAC
jgi:hypothetical protein